MEFSLLTSQEGKAIPKLVAERLKNKVSDGNTEHTFKSFKSSSVCFFISKMKRRENKPQAETLIYSHFNYREQCLRIVHLELV